MAEQTVYNYFPGKEQLVIDRDQEVRDRLCDLIRSRPRGTTAAAAIRDFVLGSVAGIRSIPRNQWRGELVTWRPSARPCTAWRWRWATSKPPPSPPRSPKPPRFRPRLQGSRGWHWPVCSRSSSARPAIARAGGKVRPRSPTSYIRSSGKWWMNSTAGSRSPSRQHGQGQTAVVLVADPGGQWARRRRLPVSLGGDLALLDSGEMRRVVVVEPPAPDGGRANADTGDPPASSGVAGPLTLVGREVNGSVPTRSSMTIVARGLVLRFR